MVARTELESDGPKTFQVGKVAVQLVKNTVHFAHNPASLVPASKQLKQQQHFLYGSTTPFQAEGELDGKAALLEGGPFQPDAGEATTLVEAFSQTVSKYPDKTLHIHLPGGEVKAISYADLALDVYRLLHGLRRHGFKAGDTVLIQVERIDYFVTLFWAVVMGGMLPAPLKPALHQEPDHADVQKLIQIWNWLDQPLIVTDLPLESVSVNAMNGRNNPLKEASNYLVSIHDLFADEVPAEVDPHPAQPEDGALFLFTSGTTGTPKCVRYRHSHVISNILGIRRLLGMSSDDVTCNWMPLYHAGGLLTNHVLAVVLGNAQVLRPVEQFLHNPCVWLDDIDAYRVTMTWAPNFAFAQINKLGPELEQGRWRLDSLRIILNVGQPISAQTAQTFLRRLKRFSLSPSCIVPAYGMTEFSGSICFSTRFVSEEEAAVHHVRKQTLHGKLEYSKEENDDTISFTEVGIPVPGIRVRITDGNGRVLPEHYIGKVQVQGVSVVDGYYKNEEASRAAFPETGWFETGDLGFVRDGRLTLVGRDKDMLIVNAKNIYNFEVEAAMAQVQGIDPAFVAAAAVSGGEAGNDELVLFFSPPEDDFTLTVLMVQQLKEQIAKQFGVNPRYVVPVEKTEFPRTPTGKLQRMELIQALLNGRFDQKLAAIEAWFLERRQLERKQSSLLESGQTSYLESDRSEKDERKRTGWTMVYDPGDEKVDELALYIALKDQLVGLLDYSQHEPLMIVRHQTLAASKLRSESEQLPGAERQSSNEKQRSDEQQQIDFLTQVFQELLNVKTVMPHDDFFQLGGDSLRMTRLLSRVAARFGISVSVRRFFERPTVYGLHRALEEAKHTQARIDRIPTRNQKAEGGKLPLTLKQKSQWFLHMSAPHSPFYTNTFTLRFSGTCDLTALQDSLRLVVDRHESLRIRFAIDDDGLPYQYVDPHFVPELEVIDLRDVEAPADADIEQDLIYAEANRRFNLLHEAPFRANVLICRDDEYVLVVSMHHIISDGWSVERFVGEWVRAYDRLLEGAVPDLPKLPVTYSDYVLWQHEREQDPKSSLWQKAEWLAKKLPLPLPMVEVPPDRPRPATLSYAGETLEMVLGPSLVKRIRRKLKRSQVTLFMFMFAAYSYLLHRLTRCDVLPIGTVLANRTLAETEPLIGFIANTAVICVRFEDKMSFDDLLDQIKAEAMDVFHAQDVPFEMVLSKLREASGHSHHELGFRVMFTLQNEFTHRYRLAHTNVELNIEAGDTAKYDLILHVYEDEDQFRLRLEYSTDLYAKSTAERFLEYYRTILEGVVEDEPVRPEHYAGGGASQASV